MKHPADEPRSARPGGRIRRTTVPAARSRQASPAKAVTSSGPPEPVTPVVQRPAAPEPRLLPRIVPIIIVGAAAMICLFSMARLSELEAESRRLDKLSLEQTMRKAALLRERTQLTDDTMLRAYAAKQNMVYPVSFSPVRVGVLPPGKLHWALPGEGRTVAPPAIAESGGASPSHTPARRSL